MAFTGSVGRMFAVTALALVCANAHAQPQTEIPIVRLEITGGRAPDAQAPALPVTRLDDKLRAADLDGIRAVSLTFSEPLPVRDVLLMMFRGTSFSIVFDPGVDGGFMGELSNLTLRQALEAVLFPADLDYSLKGSVVRVSPRRAETRLFEVSRLNVQRELQRRVRSVAAPDDGTVAADLSAATESDFFGELGAGVRALLSQSGRFHVDRTAGLVQVTDFADRLDAVGVYLERIALRASRQVRLHARVLEVTLEGPSFVDWTAVASRAGSAVAIGSGAGIRVSDFDGLIRAIGSFGAVRQIAAPQVLAMNNEPAVMRVGSQYALFAIPASQGRLAARETNGEGVSVKEGLTLTITPQIDADGVVQMSVSPTFTEDRSMARGPKSVIEADTVMRVRQGETVIISGLVRETGPPGAKAAEEQGPAARKEFIVLLTATVVMAGSSAAAGAQ